MRGVVVAGMKIGVVAAMLLALGAVVGMSAGAKSAPRAFVPDSSAVLAPQDWPNDPALANCEDKDPNTNCGGSEQWDLYGRLAGDTCKAPGSNVADQPHPDGGLPCWAVNAKDPQHAAGINATGAWAQGNWGRDDVLIGYIEGGVNYSADSIKDGLNNIYLNPGESPFPQGEDGQDRGRLDFDGNGRFDIRDYAQDPRVNPQCPSGTAPFTAFDEGTTRGCAADGQHDYLNTVKIANTKKAYLSPEDLIAVFGHCKVTAGKLGDCPSKGKFDNDANGYPNDISGWNVARNTNDPQTEDADYGHASSLIAETVAQRNDGYNKIGTCPDCRIVPIKQGAECLGLSNKWAEALLYGANLGVKVISSVVVSYQYSSYGRDAVEYANRKGILLSFDSNDFDSTDHTDGMLYPHAIPGNSVVTNDNKQKTATTKWFRARSNVTSYGPHHVFSGMQTTTSGATPFMAGLLAMVQSAALNAKDAGTIPRAYTPNEVRQALMNTASAVVPQTQAPDVAKQWPGNPDSATDDTHTNWSTQYGYGRIDLGAATALVKSGIVPPTTEFEAPEWYAYVDPAVQKTLPVTGYIQPAAWKSQGVTWTVEWATGADPKDSDFHTISTGKGAKTGLLGTLNLKDIPKDYAAKAPSNTNTPNGPQNYAVTLRIRALDGNGLKAEDRRTFTARTDPTLVNRTPTKLGGEPAGGTTYADVEGRHEQDLVVGTADGELRVTRPDSTSVPGFPKKTWKLSKVDPDNPENFPAESYKDPKLRDVRDPISGTAVGDLNRDGSLDIVATTNNAYVYAWDNTGKALPGFPVRTPKEYASLAVPTPRTATNGSRFPARGNWSPPVLSDLDGDGKLEILMSAFDGHVYAWKSTGRPVPGWPVEIKPTEEALAKAGADPAKLIRDPKLMYSVGVGDVLGTGHPQVFVGGFDCAEDKDATFAYGIHPDGNNHPGGPYLAGWPVNLKSLVGCYSDSIDFVEEGVSPPVIMPVEGKNRVVASSVGNSPQVIAGDGSIVRGLSLACASDACKANPPYFPGDGLTATITGQGGAGDLLGTGAPNFVQSVVGAISTQGAVGGSTAGEAALGQSYEKAWDVATGNVIPGFPARQDGFSFFDAPLVAGLQTTPATSQRAAVEANDSSWIHAYQPDGTEAPGFPKYVGQWPSFSGVISDPKFDGKLRVAYGTREGYLFQWNTQGAPETNDQWWHFHHDERNTNQWGLDTRRPALVAGLKVKRSGSKVTIRFRAPGNDGVVGRAGHFEAWRSTSPKGTNARSIKVPKPAAAGTTQKIVLSGSVLKRTQYLSIRAVDLAGNIGPTRSLTVKAPKQRSSSGR